MNEYSMIFYTTELVYDIQSRAYALSRSYADNGETPERHNVWLMDVAQEQWDDRLHHEIAGRIMSLAFHKCQLVLNDICTQLVESGYVGSDKYKDTAEYTLHIGVSDVLNEGQVKTLKELIHEYIVYRVLYEWCMLVAREHVDAIKTLFDEANKALTSLVASLIAGDYERPYFPF